MTPRSLVWATDIDVLPADKQVFRRGDHLVVRSPSNPDHYWGNLLIFDRAPRPGERAAWIAAFTAELPEVGHCTLAWDGAEGDLAVARTEFSDFDVERTVGLIAAPAQLHPHPRADAEVEVRQLDPGSDGELWSAVIALWERQRVDDDEPAPPDYGGYARRRLAELRTLFAAGRGGWFVALDHGEVVGSLGVVVTRGRARYQSVDTRVTHRGRGIASRLVHEAAERIGAVHPVDSLVIAADPDYHALGIYESLGFVRAESVAGVCRWPGRV